MLNSNQLENVSKAVVQTLCGAVWFREVDLEINGLSDYSPLDWKMQHVKNTL